MKISELIKELEKAKQKHGDVKCEAWQHPEEGEGRMEITRLYFSNVDNKITIS